MVGCEEKLSYRVFLLRFWQERPATEGPAVWRFSVEDPVTRQRRGFADLQALTQFLASEIALPALPDVDTNEVAVSR
jgi:hypothetical protein